MKEKIMKLRTRKAAAKRIKVKKNVLSRKKAFKSHLMKTKNAKRCRRLSEPTLLHAADVKTFYRMLPYA
jgi:ribosomal protein L35